MLGKFDLVFKFLEKCFGKRGSKIIICLVLIACGIKSGEIKALTGVSYDSIRKYKTALEEGGIDALFVNNGYREKSELEKYDDIIAAAFNKNPPKTLREAQERIKELTGLTRSINRTRAYLKKRALKAGL